jgi:ribose 1,5-bisphosphokinase
VAVSVSPDYGPTDLSDAPAAGAPDLSRDRGVFVAVVGPSGAGKDSVIEGARQYFAQDPDVIFARRFITRPKDQTEDHEPVPQERFETLERTGGLALSWRANGLCYGLPAQLSEDLGRGAIVVANISRDVVPQARAAFARTLVIHVTARPDVIHARLADRGRESPADQQARIARSAVREATVNADVRIENNGALRDAQQAFIRILMSFRKPRGESSGPRSVPRPT